MYQIKVKAREYVSRKKLGLLAPATHHNEMGEEHKHKQNSKDLNQVLLIF
jgi:hypothetical protein